MPRSRAPLKDLVFPQNLPPLLRRLLDDWRGFYAFAKTRKHAITLEDDELARCKALAQSFGRRFSVHPAVSPLEPLGPAFALFGSVVIHGSRHSFHFPYDLLIHESHAEILPILARWLAKLPAARLTAPDFEIDFLDRVIFALARMTMILKKNDVRTIKAFTDPAFLTAIDRVLPTEEQLARHLGVTDATAQMRMVRLLEVHALRLTYLPHPGALGYAPELVEIEWPPSSEWEALLAQTASVAFPITPTTGIAIVHLTNGPPPPLACQPVSHFYSRWNLAPLDNWNRESFPIRPPLTGTGEEEILEEAVLFDLGQRPSPLAADELALLRQLNARQDTVVDTAGLARLQQLIAQKQCQMLPAFRHIGLDAHFLVYATATPSNPLAGLVAEFLSLPQASVYTGAEFLVAAVGLPNAWSHGFQQDLADLAEIWPLRWHVVTHKTLQRPVTFLLALKEEA